MLCAEPAMRVSHLRKMCSLRSKTESNMAVMQLSSGNHKATGRLCSFFSRGKWQSTTASGSDRVSCSVWMSSTQHTLVMAEPISKLVCRNLPSPSPTRHSLIHDALCAPGWT